VIGAICGGGALALILLIFAVGIGCRRINRRTWIAPLLGSASAPRRRRPPSAPHPSLLKEPASPGADEEAAQAAPPATPRDAAAVAARSALLEWLFERGIASASPTVLKAGVASVAALLGLSDAQVASLKLTPFEEGVLRHALQEARSVPREAESWLKAMPAEEALVESPIVDNDRKRWW